MSAYQGHISGNKTSLIESMLCYTLEIAGAWRQLVLRIYEEHLCCIADQEGRFACHQLAAEVLTSEL